nr:MAG TPA: hypothetical protein [Caudoviricetes sp.]
MIIAFRVNFKSSIKYSYINKIYEAPSHTKHCRLRQPTSSCKCASSAHSTFYV